jgi:hypothetical protein
MPKRRPRRCAIKRALNNEPGHQNAEPNPLLPPLNGRIPPRRWPPQRPRRSRNSVIVRLKRADLGVTHCRNLPQNSQWMAASIVGAKVAGAYVRRAAYRRAESDRTPLEIGGRKSRGAAMQPRAAKLVKVSFFTAAKRRTKLTVAGELRHSRPSGRCVCAETSPSWSRKRLTRDIGGRKSREAAQPRGAKSVTAWPFPLPRGAAKLTGAGRQRRRRQRGGAYVRRAAYRRAESDSTPLDIGSRKSREAGAQPRGAKSVTAWPFPLPRSAARLKGLAASVVDVNVAVRTCGKQPIVGQKATRHRSMSAIGRVIEPKHDHGARSR